MGRAKCPDSRTRDSVEHSDSSSDQACLQQTEKDEKPPYHATQQPAGQCVESDKLSKPLANYHQQKG